MQVNSLKLNSSNQHKLELYIEAFGKYGISIESTMIEIKEIESDPLSVVVHKASQVGEQVLVEDTSLKIEGVDAGIHIKAHLSKLDSYIGKKATWRLLLACQVDGAVYVYKGSTIGQIVKPRVQDGFGFTGHFLPDGSDLTLAEGFDLPEGDARDEAVRAFMEKRPFAIRKPIFKWDGPMQ